MSETYQQEVWKHVRASSSSIYLRGGDDIQCPHCKKKWDVLWDTEYAEPDFGEHFVDCPNCDKRIYFGCWIQYTQPKFQFEEASDGRINESSS